MKIMKMDPHITIKILLGLLFCLAVSSADDLVKKETENVKVDDISTPPSSSPNASSSASPSVSSVSSQTETSNSSITASPTETPTSVPTTPPIPTIPPLLNNICNISFKTVIEKEIKDSTKCKCDGQHGNVDCSHLGITELHKQISFPPAIKIANLRGNKISNLNADTFYNARTVTEIDLSSNQIDFMSINAFLAFKVLTRLDLSHNRIWNLPKGMFSGLSNLRRLDLSYNNLINVFPGHFEKIPELRELILKNNPMEELEPKHFEHLTKLEYLDLESTLLKVIPDHVFMFTPHLKFLRLASNQLSMVPTVALHVLDDLKTLDLSGNPIEIIHQEAFIGLRKLDTLYLDRMPQLTSIGDYAFGDLEHLETLQCNYNFRLSEIDPYAFVKRANNEKIPLAQLFLRQNDLRKIPQSLLDWNQGLELHLRDNPLHCDCHIQWMVNTKLKNDFQSQAKCYTPADVEGVVMSQLKGQQLSCGLELSDIVLIVCGVIMGILILVLIVSVLYWRRNYRGYTKPHFYKTNKNVNNDIDYTGGDDGF